MSAHAPNAPECERTDTAGAAAPPRAPAPVPAPNGVGLGTLMALHKRVRRTGGPLTLPHLAAHCAVPVPRGTGA